MLHERMNREDDGVPAREEFEKYWMLKSHEDNRTYRKCSCQRFVTKDEATELVDSGEAYWRSTIVSSYGFDKQRVYTMNDSIVLRSAKRTPKAKSGGEKAQTEDAASGKRDAVYAVEANHEVTLAFRALLFRGIVLKDGKYLSGEPTVFDMLRDDPFYGRTILIFFGYDPRTNYTGSVK